MDLPVKFPSEAEVILEDVARFRALAPNEQFRTLRSLMNTGDYLRRRSPKAAWAEQYALEQKVLERRKVREFFARHGY